MFKLFKKTFNLASFSISEAEKGLLFTFQVGGFISLLEYWTENAELTSTELFTFYNSAISNGVVNFVRDNMTK